MHWRHLRPLLVAALGGIAIVAAAADMALAASFGDPPGNVQAVALSNVSIRLTWTDTATQEEGYVVDRRLSPTGTYTEIGRTTAAAGSGSQVTYTDTGLASSTTYYYRVRAFKHNGPKEVYGAEGTASAQTLAPPTTTSTSTSSTTSSSSSSTTSTSTSSTTSTSKTTTTVIGSTTSTSSSTSTSSTLPTLQPPVALAGPDRATTVGTVLTFDGRSSYDPDGGAIAVYYWNWGDNSAWGTAGLTTHAYAATGTYTVTLWVLDNEGVWGSDTAVVTVTAAGGSTTTTSSSTSTSSTSTSSSTTTSTSSTTSTSVAGNQPPVANAGPDRQVITGLPIAFDGSGSYDPNGTITVYSWQFGDGGTASTVAPSHTYATAGTYTVTLWVQDNAGAWDSDTALVTVTAGGASAWAKRFGGTLTDVGTNATASDTQGNVIISGIFQNSANFGGTTLVSAGLQDGFVAKYSAAGVHLWSRRFGGSANETVEAIAVDGAGDVVVIGSFSGTADFGGGNLASAGGMDVYVAKYAGATGSHLWSKRFGDSYDDTGYGVAMSTAGDVYAVGRFVLRINFGGGQLTSPEGGDSYVAKLSGSSGGHLWSRNCGSTALDEAIAVALDPSGNPVVAGRFLNTIDCGGGPLTSAGGIDLYVAKFAAATGGHLWSRRAGGTLGDEGKAVIVDTAGDVLVTGVFEQSTNLGGSALTATGSNDSFVVKYAGSNGAHRWSRNFTSSGNDWGLRVAWDATAGEAVVTGYFEGTLNPGTGTLTSAGGRDIYAVGLNGTSGAATWATRYGASTNDEGRGVTATATGAVLLTGFFTGSVDFGYGPLTSAGGGDVFLRSLVP